MSDSNPLDQLVERLNGSAKIERVCGDEMFARELEAAATLLLSQQETIARLARALEKLADDAEAQLCQHESTHRGGAIWTICDECDRKWADDEDGFQPYETPAYIRKARSTLSPIRREP